MPRSSWTLQSKTPPSNKSNKQSITTAKQSRPAASVHSSMMVNPCGPILKSWRSTEGNSVRLSSQKMERNRIAFTPSWKSQMVSSGGRQGIKPRASISRVVLSSRLKKPLTRKTLGPFLRSKRPQNPLQSIQIIKGTVQVSFYYMLANRIVGPHLIYC